MRYQISMHFFHRNGSDIVQHPHSVKINPLALNPVSVPLCPYRSWVSPQCAEIQLNFKINENLWDMLKCNEMAVVEKKEILSSINRDTSAFAFGPQWQLRWPVTWKIRYVLQHSEGIALEWDRDLPIWQGCSKSYLEMVLWTEKPPSNGITNITPISCTGPENSLSEINTTYLFTIVNSSHKHFQNVALGVNSK